MSVPVRPKLPCFACGKAVKWDSHGIPSAVIFDASGNYGSTVLDNNGFHVEIVVHDACLVRLKRRCGTRHKYTPQPEYLYGRLTYSRGMGMDSSRRVR